MLAKTNEELIDILVRALASSLKLWFAVKPVECFVLSLLCLCVYEQQQAERMSPRVAEAMLRIDRALFIPKTGRTHVDYYFGLHATDNPAYLVRCCLRRQHSAPRPHS